MRGVVLAVANEPHVQAFLTNGPGRALARRFVAGETLDEALQSARELGRQGARVSLDYLGESIHSLDEALAARAVYRDTIGRSATELTIPSSFSLKPSQFGLDLDRNRSLELLADVVAEAMRVPTGVRLDMEDSAHTDGTLWLADELAQRGLPVGVVLQAALYRTPGDLDRVLARGGSVRLCKGAYREPASLAYPRKPDVDAAYARLLERLLRAAPQIGVPGPGSLPPAAIATHDPRLIHRAIELIHDLDLDSRLYEFQMLYGVRRDLQSWLLAQGYPLRVYTPWGPAWYPYLTRRLAERPANLTFMVKALVQEATTRRRSATAAHEKEPTFTR